MATIRLTGRITESGKLEVELPEGLPPGEVEVTIDLPAAAGPAVAADDWERQPWTAEEIREFFRFEPKTGPEIAASGVIGAWADMGIVDTNEWLEELRRRIWRRYEW